MVPFPVRFPRPEPAALLSALVTGRTESHLCTPAEAHWLGAPVHDEVVAPLLALRREAHLAGFDLRVLSGFRSFERQRSIWNRKVAGELAVLDSDATPLDPAALSPRELVRAILRWSALPGASRHHWGTDLDVYDERARPPGYTIELLPEEVEEGGMFGPLHAWLDERVAEGRAFGFFRPYDCDRGGVAPERWHLSHAPVAEACARALTPTVLREALAGAGLAHEEVVLRDLEEIWDRFVVNVAGAPA